MVHLADALLAYMTRQQEPTTRHPMERVFSIWPERHQTLKLGLLLLAAFMATALFGLGIKDCRRCLTLALAQTLSAPRHCWQG